MSDREFGGMFLLPLIVRLWLISHEGNDDLSLPKGN